MNTSVVMKKLGVKGAQAALALSMSTSEASVSRIKSEQVEQVCVLLAHAGLKVVDTSMICYPREKVEALLTLAKVHLASIKNVEQLSWEDEVDA